MKNIVLTALNTRHTHSALGLAYIKSFWEKDPAHQPLNLIEFDLNQTNEGIIADLILLKPDILAFSVYIWSLPRALAVAGAIKAAFPDCLIIFGGPEVSFNSEAVMAGCPAIDFIVRGEGEITFSELLETLLAGQPTDTIAGVTRRCASEIIRNSDRPFIKTLDEIPSPFRSGIYKGVHSFTYYEASRGCPSRCTYCLSSVLGPVRNHSIERVKADLDWFFNSDYRQVRFADRTFNFDRERAREIITYIKANNHRNINFHFEIQADFLSEDIIDLLSDAPDGMFHLEIGIQSTNPDALKAVNRRFNLEILRDRIGQLKKRTKCHLHLDILGALPCDTLRHFYQSLDDVWNLSPHSIQISLVKVLRGTPLENQLKEGRLAAMSEPPYTVLRTRWLSPDEAIRIQDVGKLVEGMHNCERFPAALTFMVLHLFKGSAASMYDAMAVYWRQKKLQFFNFSPENMARQLLAFAGAGTPDRSLLARCRSLIEHELRLTQKIPAGETFAGPDFEPRLKKHPFRVTQGIRVFWYEFDPVAMAADPANVDSGAILPFVPVVYRFERDLSATPSIEILDFDLALRFALAAVQNRADPAKITEHWASTFPQLAVPDFSAALEKLQADGLIYKAQNH
ncbi:hypothetical protein MASR1M12_20350 [Erysipelotrichia bacterium]